jgi:hypothetical protein
MALVLLTIQCCSGENIVYMTEGPLYQRELMPKTKHNGRTKGYLACAPFGSDCCRRRSSARINMDLKFRSSTGLVNTLEMIVG